MFSIDDYLLVERNGKMFRFPLHELNSRFLMVEESDNIDELNERIDEISSYIVDLSASVIEDFTPISELDTRYETIISTDYILSDGSILTSNEIKNKISESNLVDSTFAENAFSREITKCDRLFINANRTASRTWMR